MRQRCYYWIWLGDGISNLAGRTPNLPLYLHLLPFRSFQWIEYFNCRFESCKCGYSHSSNEFGEVLDGSGGGGGSHTDTTEDWYRLDFCFHCQRMGRLQPNHVLSNQARTKVAGGEESEREKEQRTRSCKTSSGWLGRRQAAGIRIEHRTSNVRGP